MVYGTSKDITFASTGSIINKHYGLSTATAYEENKITNKKSLSKGFIGFAAHKDNTKQNYQARNQEIASGKGVVKASDYSKTYGDYYTSYMGYKTSQSDKSQEYSTDYTWYDFFANSAVSTIKETKALLKDADANGFTYDNEDADYDEFIGKLKDAANKADTSYSDYLKQMFGKRATEKRVKEFLKDYLKSTAYQEKLTETLAASDSEVSAYYEDNKDTYDKFEYRMFKVKAESSDSSDMANAKETANSFASGVSSELDFINQCRKFAEAGDDTYADDAASLVTETKKSNIEEACADWIASSDRKEGDLTVIEDDDNTCFYIVYYISRSYDGSDDDAIKSTLLNQKYSEYIKKYTDEYSVNVKKRFSYK